MSEKESEEDKLVAAARAGDRDAFGDISVECFAQLGASPDIEFDGQYGTGAKFGGHRTTSPSGPYNRRA
jgi:hypothetical protein